MTVWAFFFPYGQVKFDRYAEFPTMEEQSHKAYYELQSRGVKVKRWWFKMWAKQILESTNPSASATYLQVFRSMVYSFQKSLHGKFEVTYKHSSIAAWWERSSHPGISQTNSQNTNSRWGRWSTGREIQTSPKLPSHLPSYRVQHMRPLIDLLSGFVAEHLGWTDDNVLCRLQFLQRESPESNFFLC